MHPIDAKGAGYIACYISLSIETQKLQHAYIIHQKKTPTQKAFKLCIFVGTSRITTTKLILLCFFYCSPLYDEIISLCLDLGELDAAIAIVADLETSGITVPDQTLDRVISARQMIDIAVNDVTS
jgi:hypothetical protein